jgi:hypothetical protein
MATIENPFAVLTAVVAPAILTNACSVLSLGTANRVARVVDRTRIIGEFSAVRDPKHSDHKHYISQLDRLQERGKLLVRALRLFYFALGAFATSALIAVIGSVLTAMELDMSFHVGAVVGLAIGAAAVGSLAAGCALMVRETILAIASMEEAAKRYTGATPDTEL